jgi:hypothetical protein
MGLVSGADEVVACGHPNVGSGIAFGFGGASFFAAELASRAA